MNDERIRLLLLLDQLRRQLAASTSVDAEVRTQLEQTLGDAEKALANPPGNPPRANRWASA